MRSRRTVDRTRNHIARRVRTLVDTFDSILVEARALRNRLELLAEARRAALERLRPAYPRTRSLDLRHANRVF